VVTALVKGKGSQTLILTGHYDVVGVGNYGSLAEWANEPDALLPRLIARLREEDSQGTGLSPADRLALEDLQNGHFLPGRGLLDMKSGLAAGLAVLERFSQIADAERKGNLLFIAVPDEEIASNGIRTAGEMLPALATTWGLLYEGAINLDASDDSGDGSQGQVVYGQATALGYAGGARDARRFAVQRGQRRAAGSRTDSPDRVQCQPE
jgi:arginine utilization protein RocB